MAKRELTLKDRLSRLTYAQACKLLGPDGNKLIVQGGKVELVGKGGHVGAGQGDNGLSECQFNKCSRRRSADR